MRPTGTNFELGVHFDIRFNLEPARGNILPCPEHRSARLPSLGHPPPVGPWVCPDAQDLASVRDVVIFELVSGVKGPESVETERLKRGAMYPGHLCRKWTVDRDEAERAARNGLDLVRRLCPGQRWHTPHSRPGPRSVRCTSRRASAGAS